MEKHNLPHASCVVAGSHSICSLSFFVSGVGRVLPQTFSGPLALANGKWGGDWDPPWEETRERLCGVQAYSVRGTFYLVMHFCAWMSESPGQLSKTTCVGFIPRAQFGRSGVHLGIRIVL